MRERDLDLIAALVEGSLEDEAEARALIEASPELRAEYEAQLGVYQMLTTTGPASLADTERAALHRDVWTALRNDAPAAATRRPWLYRMVSVAAGLLVVVGLAAVVGQNLGSGESTEMVAADGGSPETTLGLATAGGEGATDAPTSTTAAEGATTDAPGDPDTAFFFDAARTVRENALIEEPQGGDNAGEEDFSTCLDAAGVPDYEILATGAPEEFAGKAAEDVVIPPDLTLLAATVPEGAEVDSAEITFVDLVACEVVAIEG